MTKRDQVRAIIERAGGTDPRVFGSVARGTDTPDSDIDLLVHLPKAWDLLDLVGLEMELEHLVGYPVDIVDDTRAGGPVIRNAAGEAVPL
jgi:predicted nucleotidyltransferase